MITQWRLWGLGELFLSPAEVKVALHASWKYLRLRKRMVSGHADQGYGKKNDLTYPNNSGLSMLTHNHNDQAYVGALT